MVRLTCLVCCLLFPTIVFSEDWPSWRGPNRTDVTKELSGWNGSSWPRKQLWRRQIGVGCSSPVIVEGKVYVLGWYQDADHLHCLDVQTGKDLWHETYRCPAYGRKALGDQGQYRGPSSTPEYDQATGYLYTLSTDGHVNCWDTKNKGKKVWGWNLFDKYTIERRPQVGRSGRRDYGYTTSPLVYKNRLLIEVGAKEGSVVALDKKTGNRMWISKISDPPGHAGGLVPITVEKVPCVAVFSHSYLTVLRLDDFHEGETVATYPWKTDFSNSIATPAVQDNHVLITSAYNHFAICKLKITLKGAEKVWQKKYASGVCSPIIHKGHIYWAWRKVYCMDYETGDLKWQGGRFSTPGSCIITGDDRLIVWAGKGHLALAETFGRSPGKYQVLAEDPKVANDLAWPHVVLADGKLICKDRRGNLVCYQLGK